VRNGPRPACDALDQAVNQALTEAADDLMVKTQKLPVACEA